MGGKGIKGRGLTGIVGRCVYGKKVVVRSRMSEYFLKASGNQAVNVNPPTGLDYHITKQGSSWLWAVTSVFGLLVVVYAILFFIAEMRSNSLTRYSLAAPFLISFFMFFFYFTYASNLGWTGIQAEFGHVKVDNPVTGLTPGVRQIFYSRFVAWFLSWPLVLFLIELSSVSTTVQHSDTLSVLDMIHTLLVQIFSAYFWIIALLVGALIRSTYKWGYFTFGAVSMLIMEAILIRRQFVTLKTRAFNGAMLGFIMVIVWLYFICWGLSEGGNRIQPDSEAVFYGILDLILFAIYPAYLLFIIKAFGDWPAFSWRGGFARRTDEEHLEKPSGQPSVRQSGETAVPQTHANHAAGAPAAATGPALGPTAEHPPSAAGPTTMAEIPAANPIARETA
ncbi:hypothetical protein HG537_0G01030 [Torulaspora globosa]|uniref:30 kDa heat shock protein n=1 Tax=Torulaspora globosa TaxID=48254 RepID=A0A7H9HX83_9SACH|nr:hypothetical protein HG537_0G01030 [Torulaspora sp. CBS 2947]